MHRMPKGGRWAATAVAAGSRYRNKGIAQGGLFDTPDGKWYAMLFQDHDAVGRIPCLVPVAWEEAWPVFGMEGKVPERFEVDLPQAEAKPLVISDEFEYESDKLALNWQWNHTPDHRLWSVTERPDFLRLTTGSLAAGVLQARNTLTQRTEGPACSGSVLLDTGRMNPGDHAGLVALQSHFGTVGVKVAENGDKFIAMGVNDGNGEEMELERISFRGRNVYLKIDFDFENSKDVAIFYYSVDGTEWLPIGGELRMRYTLDHFMGYRIGLYYYASRQIGGHADVQASRQRQPTGKGDFISNGN